MSLSICDPGSDRTFIFESMAIISSTTFGVLPPKNFKSSGHRSFEGLFEIMLADYRE
jgi:hypothetical protein